MKRLHKNKKGFTLIELIVVMAVIGILVLLAAPKFLGYTKDAKVTAMQSDAKILSNAALMFNIENEKYPATEETADGLEEIPAALAAHFEAMNFDVDATDLVEIDEDALKLYVKNLHGEYDDYVLVVDGELEGEVFHKEGVDNRGGIKQFGIIENKADN